ncbi:MAG: ATP-binding protein [Bacteroidales bacterium]|jgi:AAA+ ATPase superfamily predicted ATPase|nr:ATP-binding protein [Bacteroidales bacterium]
MEKHSQNPFKFGSTVENDFFTDRTSETRDVRSVMNSRNHLILISPRRFGKTSLVNKAASTLNRPYIYLDLQLVTDVSDIATQLLKKVLKIDKWEKVKHFLTNLRITPTIAINPLTNDVEVSFPTSTTQNDSKDFSRLEDVLDLIENIGKKGKRPIVVFDEFQEIMSLSSHLSKQLRAVIQHHQNVNYVFLGSMESMMIEIFERKKSPFYHFGHLMTLKKIPYNDFYEYLQTRLKKITNQNNKLSTEILEFTDSHPYYTQQLAYYTWDYLEKNKYTKEILGEVTERIVSAHNIDYERLWNTMNSNEKKILITLCAQKKISTLQQPTSTTYSGLNRLMKQGYVVKNENYELEDPFFNLWIINRRK